MTHDPYFAEVAPVEPPPESPYDHELPACARCNDEGVTYDDQTGAPRPCSCSEPDYDDREDE